MAKDSTKRKASELRAYQEFVEGCIVAQASICKFLIDEGVIDKNRLAEALKRDQRKILEETGEGTHGSAFGVLLSALDIPEDDDSGRAQ